MTSNYVVGEIGCMNCGDELKFRGSFKGPNDDNLNCEGAYLAGMTRGVSPGARRMMGHLFLRCDSCGAKQTCLGVLDKEMYQVSDYLIPDPGQWTNLFST